MEKLFDSCQTITFLLDLNIDFIGTQIKTAVGHLRKTGMITNSRYFTRKYF